MTDTIQGEQSSPSLQEQLRNFARWDTMTSEMEPEDHLCYYAADEIDSLQESNTSLREEIDRLQRKLEESQRDSDRLERELAEWKRAANEGHPSPCTLGPLCPYCEIERLNKRIEELDRELAEAKRIIELQDRQLDAWRVAEDARIERAESRRALEGGEG